MKEKVTSERNIHLKFSWSKVNLDIVLGAYCMRKTRYKHSFFWYVWQLIAVLDDSRGGSTVLKVCHSQKHLGSGAVDFHCLRRQKFQIINDK